MHDPERLSIATDGRMRRVQRVRDLRADVRRQLLGKARAVGARQLEHGAEGRAVDVVDDEDRPPFLRLEVVDGRQDGRVVQHPDDAGFVRQHGGEALVAAALRRQHLEHHVPPEGPCPFHVG